MAGGYIYKLTSRTSRKSYVGYTTKTPEERFAKHVHKAQLRDGEGCRHLNNAINLYTPGDFIVATLFYSATATIEELKQMEVHMIEEHNTKDPHGYNLTVGGDGFSGGVMPLSAREQLSVNHRIFNAGDDLGLNVCNWDQGNTRGFVVKVPGKDWKYFTDPTKTYEQRRDEAKAYRDHLLAGGEQKQKRTKKHELPYDLPDYVYYKSTQDGFNVNIGGVNKNYVTKGKMHHNLFKAMKYYTEAVDPNIDDVNWLKAYNIIEELAEEFKFV